MVTTGRPPLLQSPSLRAATFGRSSFLIAKKSLHKPVWRQHVQALPQQRTMEGGKERAGHQAGRYKLRVQAPTDTAVLLFCFEVSGQPRDRPVRALLPFSQFCSKTGQQIGFGE